MTHRLTLYQSREKIDEAINSLCDRLVADGKIDGYTALVLMDGAETFFNRLSFILRSQYGMAYGHVVKLAVKSYDGMQSTGGISGLEGFDRESLGYKIVVFDDIYDTGSTWRHVRAFLSGDGASAPAEICPCMLFRKDCGGGGGPCPDGYYGMVIRDEFVVGYGLDYNDQYRDLDGLYILSPED